MSRGLSPSQAQALDMAQASISRSLSPLKLSFSQGFQAEPSQHNTRLQVTSTNSRQLQVTHTTSGEPQRLQATQDKPHQLKATKHFRQHSDN